METPITTTDPLVTLDRVILTSWEPEVYSPTASQDPLRELVVHALFYQEALIKDSDLILNEHVKRFLSRDEYFEVFRELLNQGLVKILRVPIDPSTLPAPLQADQVAQPITARAREISMRKGLKADLYEPSEADRRFFARVDTVLSGGSHGWRHTRPLPSANPFAELLGDLLANRAAYELNRFQEFSGIDEALADVVVRCCREPGYWLRYVQDAGRPTSRVGESGEFHRFGAYTVLEAFPSGSDNIAAKNLIQSVFNSCYCDNEDSAGRWGGRLVEAPLQSASPGEDTEFDAVRVEPVIEHQSLDFIMHPGIVDVILRTKEKLQAVIVSTPRSGVDLPEGVPIVLAEASSVRMQLQGLAEIFAETLSEKQIGTSKLEAFVWHMVPVVFEVGNEVLGLGAYSGVPAAVGEGIAYPGSRLSRAVRIARRKNVLEARLKSALDVRCSKVTVLRRSTRPDDALSAT